MAVDRELRQQVIENVMGVLRREITVEGYRERRRELLRSMESREVEDLAARRACEQWWFAGCSGLLERGDDTSSAEERLRWLAFLRSELDLQTVEDVRPPLYRPIDGLVMAAVTVAACVVVWRLRESVLLTMGTGWAALGLSSFVWGRWRRKRRDCDKGGSFSPFNDEAQYEAHRHLLSGLGLPARALPPSDLENADKELSWPMFFLTSWYLLLPVILIGVPLVAAFGPILLVPGFLRRDQEVAVPAEAVTSRPDA